MVFGKVVRVEVKDFDRYGRTVADVILPNGRVLNQELVAAGLAWWYRQYAPHDDKLRKLEDSARREKRGLWADPNPVPPWCYRKQKKGRACQQLNRWGGTQGVWSIAEKRGLPDNHL